MNCFEKNTPIDKTRLNAIKMLYLNKEVRIVHGARMHYGKIGKVTEVTPYGLLNVNKPSNFTGTYENILVPPDYVEFCNEGKNVSLYPKIIEDEIMNNMIEKILDPKIGPCIAPGLPFVKAKTVDRMLITSKADLGKDFKPKKIIHSGPKTIVFFKNGEKVIVSCGENETYDDYTAFCAALAKKIFGSTSRAKKIMRSVTVEKKEK